MQDKASSVGVSLLQNRLLCSAERHRAPSPAESSWLQDSAAAPVGSPRRPGVSGRARPNIQPFIHLCWGTQELTGGTSPAPPCGQRHTLRPPPDLEQSPARNLYYYSELTKRQLDSFHPLAYMTNIESVLSYSPWEVLVVSLPDAQTTSNILPPNEQLASICKATVKHVCAVTLSACWASVQGSCSLQQARAFSGTIPETYRIT